MPTQPATKRVVLVFGTFDLLHEGHRHFLKQASKYGSITAIVARDTSVFNIKSHKPYHNEKTRLKAVQNIPEVKKAILGDKIQGSYVALKKIQPSIICLGYDQQVLEKNIREQMKRGELQRIKILRLKAHKPKHFKTSIKLKELPQ